MLKKLRYGLDKILEILTAVSMAVLTIDVTWQVITRFLLKNPSDWTEELATYLMIWVGLLGAAVALSKKEHLGIDYFVRKLPEKKRLYSELFIYAMVSFFSVGIMLLGGIQLVGITLARGQLSPALKIPMGYVYLAVPIAGFFLLIYSIEFFIETIEQLKKVKEAPYISVETDKN